MGVSLYINDTSHITVVTGTERVVPMFTEELIGLGLGVGQPVLNCLKWP